MHISTTVLDTLIRPRLLIVSARYALRDYKRAHRLARLLGLPMVRSLPTPQVALSQLLERERALEHARRTHDASWSASEHVAVMTALLHEALLDMHSPTAPALPRCDQPHDICLAL
ncbi:DUF6477 family protein [Roseinatronobacter monicus]|uniref:DUF6477 family protein n=1 Tax=Roseinatronobacter monicus TaxID=393481 RepID=UPI003F37DFF0